MEQITPTLRRPAQKAPSQLSPQRLSLKRHTCAYRVKEMIWPTWHSLPSSLKGLVLPFAHCGWVARRERCSFGSRKCALASRCQTVAEEDAGGEQWMQSHSWSPCLVWGRELCTQLLLGILRALGVDRSLERGWSHNSIPSTCGPSLQPGSLSSLSLIFILGQVFGCLLETDKTEKGVLT